MINMPLTKLSETSTTITLGWTPPVGVEWYTLFAGYKRVSNHAPAGYKQVTFGKTTEPYQVVAIVQTSQGVFDVAVGTYKTVPGPTGPTGTPIPPQPVAKNAAGVMNWGNLKITTHTASFGWVCAAGGNEFAVAKLPVQSVFYKSILSASNKTDGRNYGLTAQQALANGWVMVDTSGKPMYSASFSDCVLLDLGNPAMQNALADAVIADGHNVGCNSIFFDDVVAQGRGYAATTPAKYPTDTDWENAMVAAMNAVATRVRAAGFYVMGNVYKAGSQLGTVAFAQRFKDAVNGIMFEGNSSRAWFDFADGVQAVKDAQAFTDPFVLILASPDDSLCNQSVDTFLSVWDKQGGGHILAPTDGSDGWGTWATKLGAK